MNINFDELRNTIRSILKESNEEYDGVPIGSELTGFEREIDPIDLPQSTAFDTAVEENRTAVNDFVKELSSSIEMNHELELTEGLNEAIIELLKDYIIRSKKLSVEEVSDMSEKK
jgi:hypothetical protein